MPVRLYNSHLIFVSHHDSVEYIGTPPPGTSVNSSHVIVTPKMIEKAKYFENLLKMDGRQVYSYTFPDAGHLSIIKVLNQIKNKCKNDNMAIN